MKKKSISILIMCFLFSSLIAHNIMFNHSKTDILKANINLSGTSIIKVGDTIEFWGPSYIDDSLRLNKPQQLYISAICQKAGKHCYIFYEAGAVLPSSSLVDSCANQFDTLIYPKLTKLIGSVPNVFDKDSNIFILALNNPPWGGFFDPGQQMSDAVVYNRWKKHSSEREIIFINSKYFSDFNEIVTHEYAHMLHWQQDHSPEPLVNPVKYWEDMWVDESVANFSEFFLSNNQEIKFINTPTISLMNYLAWDRQKLLMIYFFDHYSTDFISILTRNQLNGISGFDSTLKLLGHRKSFNDVFEDWVISYYINDTVFENGKYSFKSCKISNLCYQSIIDCQVSPLSLNDGKIASYGMNYFNFETSQQNPIIIKFYGDKSSKFRLAFIALNNKEKKTLGITSIIPDISGEATFAADPSVSGCDKIVMTVMNVDALLGEGEDTIIGEGKQALYSYSVQRKTEVNNVAIHNDITINPNPTNEYINIRTNNLAQFVEVIDILGKNIAKYHCTGAEMIQIPLSNLAKSVYFIKITYRNNNIAIKKIIKM